MTPSSKLAYSSLIAEELQLSMSLITLTWTYNLAKNPVCDNAIDTKSYNYPITAISLRVKLATAPSVAFIYAFRWSLFICACQSSRLSQFS